MSDQRTPPHRVDWESSPQWRAHAHAELAPPPDGRVRARWTHVLALGVGAFALSFLLFAPSLQHDAQVSPVGGGGRRASTSRARWRPSAGPSSSRTSSHSPAGPTGCPVAQWGSSVLTSRAMVPGRVPRACVISRRSPGPRRERDPREHHHRPSESEAADARPPPARADRAGIPSAWTWVGRCNRTWPGPAWSARHSMPARARDSPAPTTSTGRPSSAPTSSRCSRRWWWS